MARYLVRRLLAFVPTLVVVSILVFFMIELAPGDPVGLILGVEGTTDAQELMRHELGLDQPVFVRLLKWFGSALRGNLGDSLFLRQPVAQVVLERYSVTLNMTLVSLFVAVVVGLSAGVIAGLNQGRVADWIAMLLALIVLSVPSFWLALNLIYFFSVKLRWFPVGGYVPFGTSPKAFFHHLALPCVSLGLAFAALIARMTRASVLEVLRMDYVRTAQAKGLAKRWIVLRHVLRNALIPIITVIGTCTGGLLGGSAITETVYTLPGLGRLVVEAVQRRDYLVVQGGILVITVSYLVINLLVDLLYVWIDPRIGYQ
jgi:peptide/nickel transport system permease protein